MKTYTINTVPAFAAIITIMALNGFIDMSWWEVVLAIVFYWALPSLLLALWFFVLIFLCWLITLGSEE